MGVRERRKLLEVVEERGRPEDLDLLTGGVRRLSSCCHENKERGRGAPARPHPDPDGHEQFQPLSRYLSHAELHLLAVEPNSQRS